MNRSRPHLLGLLAGLFLAAGLAVSAMLVTKVEMLADATRDAQARAEQMARQGGSIITRLEHAEMGVFQITPRYEIQTSWEGMNDTTSADKTITAVVTATFALK